MLLNVQHSSISPGTEKTLRSYKNFSGLLESFVLKTRDHFISASLLFFKQRIFGFITFFFFLNDNIEFSEHLSTISDFYKNSIFFFR